MASDQQHPLLSKGVLHARDQQWKRIRSVISYAFTATKFRQVFSHLDEVCDRFLDILSEKDAKGTKEVDAYALFNLLTMEYICGGSFGIANNFQQEPEHPFFRAAIKVLPGTMTGTFHMIARRKTLYIFRCPQAYSP
ncbi:hypothetical protein HPB48_017934 [Haemaphysalis longicornis]|uniref:Cytochrome P450 n=1 Tax=Haemaphysalis longicornis TaxID=44386 RepID=A0A9J6GA89_HAELO|nr:hypothetical protein HPB48_017934 [Haemaphysalis longicornis]